MKISTVKFMILMRKKKNKTITFLTIMILTKMFKIFQLQPRSFKYLQLSFF